MQVSPTPDSYELNPCTDSLSQKSWEIFLFHFIKEVNYI